MLLLANNPFRSLPRLRNRQLLIYLPLILLIAAGFGAIGGCLGYHGQLTRLDSDFKDMVEANIFRPTRFMCCWGVHLGGYVGGAGWGDHIGGAYSLQTLIPPACLTAIAIAHQVLPGNAWARLDRAAQPQSYRADACGLCRGRQ